MHFAVLQKVKGPRADVPQAKSKWNAPISDFVVSDDDDVDDGDSDSDSDIEAFDYHSPMQVIRSTANKENEPTSTDLTDDSVEATKKPGIVQYTCLLPCQLVFET